MKKFLKPSFIALSLLLISGCSVPGQSNPNNNSDLVQNKNQNQESKIENEELPNENESLENSNSAESAEKDWQTYKNDTLGIQFKYPKNWLIREEITKYNNRIYIENKKNKDCVPGACPKDFLIIYIDYREPSPTSLSYEEQLKGHNKEALYQKAIIKTNTGEDIHTYELAYNIHSERSGFGPRLEAVWQHNTMTFNAMNGDSVYKEDNETEVDILKRMLATMVLFENKPSTNSNSAEKENVSIVPKGDILKKLPGVHLYSYDVQYLDNDCQKERLESVTDSKFERLFQFFCWGEGYLEMKEETQKLYDVLSKQEFVGAVTFLQDQAKKKLQYKSGNVSMEIPALHFCQSCFVRYDHFVPVKTGIITLIASGNGDVAYSLGFIMAKGSEIQLYTMALTAYWDLPEFQPLKTPIDVKDTASGKEWQNKSEEIRKNYVEELKVSLTSGIFQDSKNQKNFDAFMAYFK